MQSPSRRQFLALSAASVLGAFFAGSVTSAQASKINVENGLALKGYDPVAYFTQNAAVKGDGDITATYEGVTYQFSSTENRDAFSANPAQYAPQYGGFCAYAVSKGYTAPIDPEAFSVVGNKLYVNYSKSVKKRWSLDIQGNIKLGDANWPELAGQ